MITKQQRDYIVKLLQNDEPLPGEFKYLLFPTTQKEYELTYAGKIRKEDLLANEDGVFPVPLQVTKTFESDEEGVHDDWKNLVIFGDNLQFLKTVYENKDPLIVNKIKGKVKLIYIDPPFATESDFRGKIGQKGYADRTKGAEFVEFLRRRLVLAKEIMADDGTIWIHLDYRMAEYIKILCDEIFSNCHLNTIFWRSQVPRGAKVNAKYFPKSCQQILVYKKRADVDPFWQAPKREIILSAEDMAKEDSYKKDEHGWFRTSDPGSYSYNSLLKLYKDNRIYVSYGGDVIFDENKREVKTSKGKINIKYYAESMSNGKFKITRAVDNIWTDIPGLGTIPSEDVGYPTQKTEGLLKRIIECSTASGDIVLDFFAGSGTSAAVAEKMGRKYIICDIGKLSHFTVQKRLLSIQNSRDLNDTTSIFGEKAKSFITCQLGLYDLKMALELEWEKYREFVSGLFEIEIKLHSISGLEFDGRKGSHPVKMFDYRKFKDSAVDESYIQEIHNIVGEKISGRIYIIAPANYVDFLADYHEIDEVRYYFLKVPYQVIKELHKVPFLKLRQPQSKTNINNLDEVVGFHFVRQPEVKSNVQVSDDTLSIHINEFKSQYYKDENGIILENFDTLSAVYVDKDYNGQAFQMDAVYFADELVASSIKQDTTDLRKNSKSNDTKSLVISIGRDEVGPQIMVIYTDIYGNDFTEIFTL